MRFKMFLSFTASERENVYIEDSEDHDFRCGFGDVKFTFSLGLSSHSDDAPVLWSEPFESQS